MTAFSMAAWLRLHRARIDASVFLDELFRLFRRLSRRRGPNIYGKPQPIDVEQMARDFADAKRRAQRRKGRKP